MFFCFHSFPLSTLSWGIFSCGHESELPRSLIKPRCTMGLSPGWRKSCPRAETQPGAPACPWGAAASAQPTLASLLNLFLPVWPLPALSPKAPELEPSSWYLLDRPSFRERCRSQGKLHAVNLTEEDPIPPSLLLSIYDSSPSLPTLPLLLLYTTTIQSNPCHLSLVLFFFFIVFGDAATACGILVINQELNLGPPQ